jgi:hypothetical protein
MFGDPACDSIALVRGFGSRLRRQAAGLDLENAIKLTQHMFCAKHIAADEPKVHPRSAYAAL